jgi:hypothetical protein
MATIHFVGGEIGGAGKSTFCMILIECYHHYSYDYHLRDADRSTPNVGWAYDAEQYQKNIAPSSKGSIDYKKKKSGILLDPWLPVVFSEDLDDFSQADRLLDLAQERDVIVNLPAQVSTSFDKWLQAGDFLSIQQELGVNFVYWWVAKAEQRSIDLLHANLLRFPSLPHILVCNQVRGVGEKWQTLLSPELKEVLSSSGIKTIDMPELILAPDERGLLDRESPRFRDLVNPEDKRLSLASKARCRKFMSTTIDSIITTGYISPSTHQNPEVQ